MIAELAPTSAGYHLLLLGHILFIIVGFGTSFVWPFMGAAMGKMPPQMAAVFSGFMMKISKPITTYAIYAAGVFGLALALAGGRMDETWVGISLAIFLAMVLFAGLIHVPNLAKLDALVQQVAGAPVPAAGAGGPPPQVAEIQSRGKAAARNGGILHLGFFVVLVLMIWQPGA